MSVALQLELTLTHEGDWAGEVRLQVRRGGGGASNGFTQMLHRHGPMRIALPKCCTTEGDADGFTSGCGGRHAEASTGPLVLALPADTSCCACRRARRTHCNPCMLPDPIPAPTGYLTPTGCFTPVPAERGQRHRAGGVSPCSAAARDHGCSRHRLMCGPGLPAPQPAQRAALPYAASQQPRRHRTAGAGCRSFGRGC